ncbi:hypothetical protein SLEP1_g55552 [Rubroshorea leprosula]|uniref:Uncharacterized protein n=1 Tax=Rubroshorea leprosula TaxID=152421 RepID=A0AAV5MFP0_9ROSI|nr:hypothetical protein SLEP1_g55552 [Rubroshorea leprosula]
MNIGSNLSFCTDPSAERGKEKVGSSAGQQNTGN